MTSGSAGTGGELPRLHERAHDSPLLTRVEVADLLGYSRTSMATVMGRDPDRWPRPAALLLHPPRTWMMLWDRDEILAAAPPAAATRRRGATATISDAEGLLRCLECGLRFRSLGRHLHAKHDLSADEYRDRHQLPATGALNCDGARQSSSDWQRARIAEDPDHANRLAPYRTPEHLDQLRNTAIESNHRTRGYDLVRAHRAPGQSYAVQIMAGRRRDRLDEQARRAGFPELDTAIAQTMHISSREAAARIGIGATTVLRHRQRLAGPQP
ncbi:hypothetical protein Ae717Ps2_6241c [Pseudonocardia sp. Ae717_Ps2]|uniref:MucR family transcriptional regulator n=1 Tax=Pseudonocardia sp. Ae717_Ps2 TaxID=1885573 RepID=UPI00094ADCB9|nr:MucR family transcriptional regulator [Pseudonocardia sp. Ae717_Ps2]OLM28645.1 hypothetical protein Ae717Ps2_6241c [Pseudonocardia sp. Ae717_Ps2]